MTVTLIVHLSTPMPSLCRPLLDSNSTFVSTVQTLRTASRQRTADVEVDEAHASSSGARRSLLEEQSETDLEVPVSTTAEEHRRVCGC